MNAEHKVYLALGSNIGDRKQAILHAIDKIDKVIGKVEKKSSLYETEPWGFVSTHQFINACICCRTCLDAFQVLKATQKIEREMGRTTKTHDGEYKDRIIDIDILMYDDLHINATNLKIPHPYMQQRDFVMIPLQEIMQK